MNREAVLGATYVAFIVTFWAGVAWTLSSRRARWQVAGVGISLASIAAFSALGVGPGWR